MRQRFRVKTVFLDTYQLGPYNNSRNLTFEILNQTKANVVVVNDSRHTVADHWPDSLMHDFPNRLYQVENIDAKLQSAPENMTVNYKSRVRYASERVGNQINVNTEQLKFTNIEPVSRVRAVELAELSKSLREIVVLGSFWSHEFSLAADIARKLAPKYDVIIAPRHNEPETLDELMRELKNQELKYGFRSKQNTFEENPIILLDTLGELREFYALGKVNIVGGGFVKEAKRGGHNPLESLVYGIPTVIGPDYDNHTQTVEQFGQTPFLKISETNNIINVMAAFDEAISFQESDVFASNVFGLQKYLRKSANITRKAVNSVVKHIKEYESAQNLLLPGSTPPL